MATKTVLYKNKGQIYPVTDSTCVIGINGGETTIKDDIAVINTSVTTLNDKFPVKTVDITDANVTTAKIAHDAINADKIADNAVQREHIADTAISAAKIADNAVVTAKIANGNVTKEKLATDVQSDLGEMKSVLYDQFAKVTLSRNPTVIEKGVATAVTVNFSFTFNDKASTPDTLSLTKNGTAVVTTNTAKTYSDNISDSTTYVLTCKKQYGDTDVDAVTKSASVAVTAYYPKFAGGNAKTTLTEADVIALTKQAINGSTAGTYNVTSTDNQYFWICVPSTFANVTKVTLGGFAVPMAAVQNVTVTGKGSYKCYRSANPLSSGTRSFVVA